MDKFKFSDKLNQAIVDGILKGYKSYINERIEKSKNMRISGSYAWVKGNHIDNETSYVVEELGVEYYKKKSSGSWEYFEFEIEEKNANEKFVFIVKSKSSINKFENKKEKEKAKPEYIRKYGEINKKVIDTYFNKDYKEKGQIGIELPPISLDDHKYKSDKSKNLRNDIKCIYVIIYEADKKSNMIKSIESYLPSVDGKLYLIDDLSEYLDKTSIRFTEDEKEFTRKTKNIFNEEGINEDIFDFEVLEEEKKSDS